MIKTNPQTGLPDLVNPAPDLSGYVPYTGATADVDLGENDLTMTGLLSVANSQVITVDTPTGLAASQIAGSYFGSEETDDTFYVSVYAYKTVGITTVYSIVSSEVNIGNNGYTSFNVSFSVTPVSGADGYVFAVRNATAGGTSYFLTTLASGTIPTDGTGVSIPTLFTPQTVKIDAVNINGVIDLASAEWDGKLRIYDGISQAVVIGNTTGNARGSKAIEITSSKLNATEVASGFNSVLIGKGTASGSDSVCIGNSIYAAATHGGALAFGNGVASQTNAVAILGTASDTNSVSIGGSSRASGGSSVAIGGALASGSAAVALGQQSVASGTGAFALAFYSEASGQYTIAIGRGVRSSGDGSVAIGYNFTDNTPNAICFGTGISSALAGNITLLRISDASGIEMLRGLLLSASGLVGGGLLGANIIQNGTFSTSSYWTLSTTWTVFFGTLRATNVVSDSNIAKTTNANLLTPILAGSLYELVYTVSSRTAGGVRAHIGGAYSTLRTANGTYTEVITALTSNLDFWFERQSGTSTTLRIDNVTLRKIEIANLNIEGSIYPLTNDLSSLGTALKSFSDLFLASGAVINFNNGDVTLTHSAGKLTQNTPFEATTLKATTAAGFISSDGSTGFTGTGAYTNFTIKDGIITAAS